MAEAAVIDRSSYPAAQEGGEGEERKPQGADLLQQYHEAPNIADLLDSDELGRIGALVKREYDIDKASRKEWEDCNKEAMKLALQVAEEKNYPWARAANIKYPLMTSATIQFAARAYPAIVPSGNIVRSKIVGKDEDGSKKQRGERISRHMSFQLLEEMEEWEPDLDKLLHIIPIAGLAYKKTYFDPIEGRNVSELATADRVVINDGAKDIKTVPRITHEIDFYPHEIEERFRSGVWRRVELGLPHDSANDQDAPHCFLEQHRTLDLDDDGYPEPYIVTAHAETSKVVRITANYRDIALNEQGEIARIERNHYFTKYEFLPNPDGGFHGIGFGYLLRPLNEAVNTSLNQLLDSGHLANAGGGFIGSGARLRSGQYRVRPGKWQKVDASGENLRNNIVPYPVKEPSVVLFQLLGLLIEAAKDISSVKDVMTGEAQGRNQSPTTTLALIEQGMQVFSAIYKRIFRSLKAEYRKLYVLNAQYLDDETYFTILDEPEAVGRKDYQVGDNDVVPAADPNMVTNMQRLGRAEYLLQFAGDPYFNPIEIRRRLLEAADIEDADELLVEEQPPDPKVAMEADKIDIEKRKLALDEFKAQNEAVERAAKALKAIAEAEAAEIGPQLEQYKHEMEFLKTLVKGEYDVERGRVSRVEAPSGDQKVSGSPSGAA